MLAYLDAGTGSMIIGAVAAGAAGAGVAIKSKLSMLRGRKAKSADSVEQEQPSVAPSTEATD